MAPRKIVISVSDGMVERNLFKTDFWTYLLQQTDLEVVLISSDREYFAYLSDRYASPTVKVLYEPYSIGRMDAALTYILNNSIHSHTVWEEQYSYWKGINGRQKRPMWVYGFFRICWYFGRYFWWRSFLRFLYKLLSSSGYAESTLIKIRPDLVFVPSINPADYKLLRQAKKQEIPCVQMIKSWDNLTSKTFLGVHPDYLIVHNEIMKSEAMRFDDMPGNRIFVSGIPQFDHLSAYRDSLLIPREKFYGKMGIDHTKRVLLFSASGDRISPHDRDYLSMLNEAISDGRLPDDLHICVRLHPKYESSFDGIDELSHVTIGRPFSYLTDGYRNWVFEKDDIAYWYNSIFHSCMVINVASTMAIDASVIDRPVISLGFDGYNQLPLSRSILRYYSRDHYRPVLETGAVSVVRSEKELIDEVNRYLNDTTYRRDGRVMLVSQQCYKADGNSSKRLVDFLVDFLRKKDGK